MTGFLFVLFANYSIKKESDSFISYSISDIPKIKTDIVLGTNKNLSNGNPNLYFKYRIDAATELYKSGKIESIIVSGDNSVKGYNEPSK